MTGRALVRIERLPERTESGLWIPDSGAETQIGTLEAPAGRYAEGDTVLYSRYEAEKVDKDLISVPVDSIYARLR